MLESVPISIEREDFTDILLKLSSSFLDGQCD